MSNELPKDIDVVVIDNTLSRAAAMARSFSKAGCEVMRFYDDDGNIRSSLSKAEQLNCLIKLWHFGDLEQKQPTIVATLTVYYGGHGANETRKPEEPGERIWRQVGTDENVLTEAEARELVTYAKGLLDKVQPDTRPKPAFLSPPKQVRLLSTMAVLCKGYLAVCAAAVARKEYGLATDFQLSEIKAALDEVGWNELQKDQEALQNMVGGLSEHISLVQSSEWWRKPFLDEEQADSRLRNALLKEFDDAIKEEWAQITGLAKPATVNGQASAAVFNESFKPVQDLLNEIRQNNAKITPAVVAGAYLALSKVFKSKRQI